MRMPSITGTQSHFAKTPVANIPRSTFNRSHGYKTTFDEGNLIPVFLDAVIPGDTFNLRMTAFARLATPIKPIMDNMYLESWFFFVPYRLLWDNFVKMMGEQESPSDSISYTIPQQTVPTGGYNTGTLEDYLGFPVGVASSSVPWTHSALPRRAYTFIWNEWFRDQNLQPSKTVNGGTGTHATGDGPDSTLGTNGSGVIRVNKRHDYFTSCLPWQQKGTAVDVPYGSIVSDGNAFKVENSAGTATGVLASETNSASPPVDINGLTGTFTASSALYYGDSGLEITPPVINELRQAFQIQKLLERDARSGTRYPETIRAHFGVTDPSMAVLQRPEYLGGGRAAITVNPVAQQSATDTGASSQTPQGNLAGIGTMVANKHGFVKSFTEHGLIMGLVAVRADLTYQQGIDREWVKETRYEHYYPSFAHLGEQAVTNIEIYTQDSAANDSVFGYQERYAEYRYKPSKITGAFRSNTAGGTSSLEIWHLSQDFASLPTLNSAFVQEAADVDRIIETSSEPHFLFDAWFQLICARPMPVFAVPGLIDHF